MGLIFKMYIQVIAYLSNYNLKKLYTVSDHPYIFKMKENDFYQKSFKRKLYSPKEDVMIKSIFEKIDLFRKTLITIISLNKLFIYLFYLYLA